MQLLDFIQTRLAFAGFPWGELRQACEEVDRGGRWEGAFLARARTWRSLAKAAELDEHKRTATQFWRWAACSYHAASFSFHLQPPARGWQTRISRLRTAARACYLHSLGSPAEIAIEVTLESSIVRGYLRLPKGTPAGAVVLVNGLDSIAEVELHVFGEWMLERGLAVLAVDLPAGLRRRFKAGTSMQKQVDAAGSAIADWVAGRLGMRRIGIFGVSFGGNIVARLLAGGKYSAGVAVSPPAFLGPKELSLDRLRRMLTWSFGLGESEVEKTAHSFCVSSLPAPVGRILLCQMEGDELFGPEHSKAFQQWGGARVKTAKFPGEHVGTSKYHLWLPAACDWLKEALVERGTA